MDTVIRRDWNKSMAIVFFFLIFSDSTPSHSDVSVGTLSRSRSFHFKIMKVFRFEEERRMCNILTARIKQPFFTNFCTIIIFIFTFYETRKAECNKKLYILFQFYLLFELSIFEKQLLLLLFWRLFVGYFPVVSGNFPELLRIPSTENYIIKDAHYRVVNMKSTRPRHGCFFWTDKESVQS